MTNKKFEELELTSDQFKVGDMVLNKLETQVYTILESGTTFFHKHKFYNVQFIDGMKIKFRLENLLGKRTVLRRK